MSVTNDPDLNMTKPQTMRTLWMNLPMSLVALGIAVIALTMTFMVVSERNYSNIVKSVAATRDGRDHLSLVYQLQTLLLNAETAQRGYLLTGNKLYLEPFFRAKAELPKLQRELTIAFMDRPDRQAQINELAIVVVEKFIGLEVAIAMAEQGKQEDVLLILEQDKGKNLMDDARNKLATMIQQMTVDGEQMRLYWERDMRVSRLGMIAIAALNLILLCIVAYFYMQDLQRRQFLVALRVNENERLSGLVAERTGELNDLSTHLQQSTERDRAALARDLHDELGGILTSAKMDIEWLRSHSLLSDEGVHRCDQISALIDEAVTIKRRVVENLRPSLLDNLGLGSALEWYINEHCQKGGVKCTLNLAEDLGVLSPDASIALFRIVQEGTTNVLRHAKAKNLKASLHIDEKNIHLVLEDDGTGLPPDYNPSKLSHGLSGMRQRARSLGGDVVWNSVPGTGTTITVTIPRKVEDAVAAIEQPSA